MVGSSVQPAHVLYCFPHTAVISLLSQCIVVSFAPCICHVLYFTEALLLL